MIANANQSLDKFEEEHLEKKPQLFDLPSWIFTGQVRPESYVHHFAEGIYVREMRIKACPSGTYALGHLHKTEHLNIMLSGKCRALVDGQVVELVAPQIFKSEAGKRKLILVLEDTRWLNIHPNPDDCEEVEILEAALIEKSETFIEYEQEAKRLKQGDMK